MTDSNTQPLPPPPEVPSELVPLPSNGVVYPKTSSLHGQKAVAIRAMTARDEDILTSRALLKSGKVMSVLLRSCMVDKAVDTGQMLAGDRNAVLVAIRISGYGPEYSVKLKCPFCEETTKRDVNLGQLPIKRIPKGVAPVAEGTNAFEYVLPHSKRRITFKLMTGADEHEFLERVERARKEGLPEELVTTRHKLQVLSIDGETDPNKLSQLISKMSARDSRDLRKHIDEVTPGVKLTTNFSCGSCGLESEEVEVPLGSEFFWPAA